MVVASAAVARAAWDRVNAASSQAGSAVQATHAPADILGKSAHVPDLARPDTQVCPPLPSCPLLPTTFSPCSLPPHWSLAVSMIGPMTLGSIGGLRARASVAKTLLRGGAHAGQRRFLSIHEYLAMDLLGAYGIPTPRSIPAHSAEEAFKAAQSFKGKGMVIKAQVLAGGRGKGHFDSGLQGGVHLIKT